MEGLGAAVLVKRLREEDAKKWTQQKIAEALGVARQTVEAWFNRENRTTNATSSNSSKPRPDARIKIPPQAKEVIAERVEAGESQAQVAADVGVSQQSVSRQRFKDSNRSTKGTS